MSPMRAAGFPPINTVADPLTITSGGPTHKHISPTTAAGNPAINTFGAEVLMMGPPTCGTIGVNGQVCMSVIRAANGMKAC